MGSKSHRSLAGHVLAVVKKMHTTSPLLPKARFFVRRVQHSSKRMAQGAWHSVPRDFSSNVALDQQDIVDGRNPSAVLCNINATGALLCIWASPLPEGFPVDHNRIVLMSCTAGWRHCNATTTAAAVCRSSVLLYPRMKGLCCVLSSYKWRTEVTQSSQAKAPWRVLDYYYILHTTDYTHLANIQRNHHKRDSYPSIIRPGGKGVGGTWWWKM